MKPREGLRSVIALTLFALVFITLSLVSYTRQSATWDEPQHLVRGFLGWHGDQRLDPEHPPFVRLWAALPLLTMPEIKYGTKVIDQISPGDWVGIGQFQYAHFFLYKQNDADRLVYRGRFMIVLLAVLLGGLVFCWARDWLGFWPAVGSLVLFCLEPNLLAHGSLITTDMGITCFLFGTLYFLWRLTRHFSAGNLTGLSLFFALSVISKFTSLVLGPIVFLLLGIHALRHGQWAHTTKRAGKLAVFALIIVWLALLSWLAVWTVYGFRYTPSANPEWVYRFQDDHGIMERTPTFARLVTWSDQHRLLPNAFTQGFLLGQAKAQLRGAYFFGQTSGTGWWYYFPAAFAIKTPIALLILLLGGLIIVAQLWRKFFDTAIFLILPFVFYLGIAMVQKLNIGLRHILPLYPMAIVLGAVAIAWLLKRDRKILITGLAALVILDGAEFARVYPHPLAFFNSFVGGPANGYKYLVDSNLDWGQDLKPLKQWMTAHQVDHINLAYFGTADPEYYGIQNTPLPGAPFFQAESVQSPRLPGYVAVSATVLSGVYSSDAEKAFYRPLRAIKPVATLGYSINIYRIDQPTR